MATSTNSEVTKSEPMLTNDEELMRSITSFDDAMRVLQESGVGVIDYADEFGDGFVLLKGTDDKSTLVGVPFVIMGIRYAEGDYSEDFSILHVVTEDGRKCIVVDGGTGIRAQCKKITDRGFAGGVLVKRGLTRSDYDYIDDKGKRTPASTFYLSL